MDAVATHGALMRTSLLLDHSDNIFLQEFGLNRTQFAALQHLHAQHGQRLVDLATVLLCERSTVTRVIDRLEQVGLVQRQADAEDRRSQRVILTAEGVRLRETVQRRFEASMRQRLAALSGEEQAQLVRLLEKLQTSLHGHLVTESH